MMKSIFLLCAMTVLLISCQENDSQELPAPDYELISIRYDIREITPEEQYVDGVIIENGISTTVTYHLTAKSTASFTSSFSYQPIEGVAFSVPIPRMDENGVMAGYSVENYPFKTHQWEVTVDSQGKTCEVPGNSVFQMRITNTGFQVTADFTCEMIDLTTDKTARITGTWFGEVFTKQLTKTNINDKIFTEEYRFISY